MNRSIIILFFFIYSVSLSQNNNVGIGTTTPEPSAVLDLFSTSSGFLTTQMTRAQRLGIAAPARSLLVHQTADAGGDLAGFWYWESTEAQWLRWAALKVGFFVFGDGTDGQVAIWSTSGTITGVDELFYDYNNSRLGVGLGSNPPGETLDIDGAIKIGNTATELPGTIRWTGLDFEGYDGTNWYSFTSGTLTGSGARGQVTFWDSPTSITGDDDLFLDLNTFNLGIGLGGALAQEKLQVAGAIVVSNTSTTIPGNIRWTGGDFEGWVGDKWWSLTSGTLTGQGADGQVTFWQSSTFLSGDFKLFYDYTNTRLGIGTTSPNEGLEVNGAVTIGNATNLATPVDGTVQWTGLDFEGWNGTKWISFTQSGPFGDGTPTEVAFWRTSRTISSDPNLYWDETNNRLGVGTSTPVYDLEVDGTMRTGGDGTNSSLILFSEQGAPNYNLAFTTSPSTTASMTFTLPPDDGDNYYILASDGNGELFWGSPFLMLGYYWELHGDVLTTIGDWGISRYGNTLTGETTKQINFGYTSTTGSAYSTLMGGLNNTASASFSMVTGGQNNTANGAYSLVPGGQGNTASGNFSYVFGNGNSVAGNYSTIAQGTNLALSGNGSYAFRGGLSTSSHSLTANNTYFVSDAMFQFNPNNNDYDFRLDGDNNDYVFFGEASSENVGLNTSIPNEKLEISGNARMSNTTGTASKLKIYEAGAYGSEYSSVSATSQTANLLYQLPEWHNIQHSGFMNDGAGKLRWASAWEITKILTHIITEISDSYTPTKRDINILVSGCPGHDVIITLPPAATVVGKEYYIKKGDVGCDVWVQGNTAAETIDLSAAPYQVGPGVYDSMFCVCDGTKWWIMAIFDGNP
ncbi:hypothetical protein ACFLSQ_04040 [Bacteroidota bacterium]